MIRRICFFALLFGACSKASPVFDTGLDGLSVTTVNPSVVVPGSTLVVTGTGFVDEKLGATRIHLSGMVGTMPVDAVAAATVVSATQVTTEVGATFFTNLGGADGTFSGTVAVEVKSNIDRVLYIAPLTTTLTLRAAPTPTVSGVTGGESFVNQPVAIMGDGFLFGADEGHTEVDVNGCFQATGASSCDAITPVTLPVYTVTPYDRTQAAFAYATSISGIGAGHFAGTVVVRNVFASGAPQQTAPQNLELDIGAPYIGGASTTSASLGEYVVIAGGGFVGTLAGQTPVDPTEVTLLQLTGSFMPDGGGTARAIDVQVIPQFFAGPQIRYVLDETDALGAIIKLRKETGIFTGTVAPIVKKGNASVTGGAIPVMLQILPVKQVVYVNFLDGYTDSLEKFGLRALDTQLRARMVAVAQRDYASVNIDFRSVVPDDFAIYSVVDIAGPDPNGAGLLGYDNTPGRDTNNVRLDDHIGGFYAATQANGDAGYGGVFLEGFFVFSKHPNSLATYNERYSNALFDQIFDPFRTDLGNNQLTGAELTALNPAVFTDGLQCPGHDRRTQVSCALYVLGNIVGTTISHETGHSLGLANPNGGDVHDTGDLPNRLMENGNSRPFAERAEMNGQGPGVFCDTEYTYLRTILPSSQPATTYSRPPCAN